MSITLATLALLTNQSLEMAQAQPVTSDASTYFYGTVKSATKPGADYIVFKVVGKKVQGLVYVQNSDVFSCFNGIYNPTNRQIRNPVYASVDFSSGKWEIIPGKQVLNLAAFPYRLNPRHVSSGATSLFRECLGVFQ